MNVHSMFPSKFVAAGDLMGQDVSVVVSSVTIEEVGADAEKRPVVHFQGMQKGMVLNRTNAKRIATMYGPEVESWVGRPVTLYPSETEYSGETVPCIRVRPAPPMLNQVQQPAVVQAAPVVAPTVKAGVSF
jgi:hypothetical protein